ncbi:hypothetical protein K9N08_00745 [Candidatus Gracilibacteria bacterium]|nr:hypothetical protein [Candidatus Gracilibacteria bacterium]MCF7856071.1 hypothetical protein [Candidatus Gracilibacteria bacterium]MCF7896490.1 hypothetical protein [Candidatus Gracilibacteria bacterium]
MKLILVNNGHNPKCEEYLVAAAKKRGLAAEVVSSEKNIFEIGKKQNIKNDLIYRIAVDKSEALLEQSFLLGNNLASFFTKELNLKRRFGNKLTRYIEFANAGVPIPPTIFSNSTNTADLKKISKKLGLPLIIKTLTGSLGNGILLVDSFFGLKTTVQFLVSKKSEFIFQKMIHESAGKHIRVVVLGEEILCAYQKSVPKKVDFRSNATGGFFSKNKIVKIDAKTKKIVLKAVAAAGVEFGGIDLLPTKNGYLVTEVNFPCNFAASQDFTGVDIAGKMLDFLIAKTARK